MQAMENLTADAPGRLSGLTFAQHLNQWVTVRNALTHGSIRRLLRRVNDPARWQDPKIGDPYASVIHGRFRLWESDATGGSGQPDEQRLVGATIQSGCARGCLSLIIQAVDWLIVDIGPHTAATGTSRLSAYRRPGSTGGFPGNSAGTTTAATRTGACGAAPRCTGVTADGVQSTSRQVHASCRATASLATS